jgi:CubicO group peptidase (beta-lactamase class C family)
MGGFTKAGLAELKGALQSHLDGGYAPGLVGLVSRGGETQVIALGSTALDGARPMRPDTVFRLASMTKPITAVAAMMLVEDGRLRLDEPVDRLLPELADRRVLRRLDGPVDDTVPADRPITVEDVLTFRLGWGIVFGSPDDYPILGRIDELGVVGFGMPDPAAPLDPDAWARRMGELPLMAQPGERWLYTLGSNVLGVLVARASGQPLEDFFHERIFEPLGMADTAFSVPPGKLDRLTTGYWAEGGELTVFDTPDGRWSRPPAFPAGDSGLASTAEDFGAFARMMLAGGVYEGRRLLSEASVRAMATDRLTPAQRAGGAEILGKNRGWGYGVAVVTETDSDGVSPGAYGWNGGFGTSWFNDPSQDLVAILLTQRLFDSPETPSLHRDFWRGTYAALA